MKFLFVAAFISLLLFTGSVRAQRAEITISFSEPFFDALLDSLYQGGAPEFPLAVVPKGEPDLLKAAYNIDRPGACTESIKLLRENNGVRTSVRFRGGVIYAPLAFSGNYNPPLIGCVPFAGFAETNIDLEFDEAAQRLIARARVLNVNLSGTGGVGGTVIAKLIQSAIDKKVNPIEIIRLEKVSFMVPVQNSGNMRMRAVGFRHEVVDGLLKVHIAYEFSRS